MEEQIQTYTAKTVEGLEEVLEKELAGLGARDTKRLTRAVEFRGGREMLYHVNYCCSTALRVLVPVGEFSLSAQEDLYARLTEMPWEQWLDPGGTLAVDAVVGSALFTNSLFVAQRSKDAIADRFRKLFGTRPAVDLEDPSLRINIYIKGDRCTVSLDSSGASLHKRGYRKRAGDAPLSEVLAAGIIRLSEWDPSVPLYDPMCGSGTILIEAAFLATGRPAGYFRKEFGFMKWKDFDKRLWEKVREKANAGMKNTGALISGADSSQRAVDGAKVNLRHSCTEPMIRIAKAGFHQTRPPFKTGMIITNPPYDERLKLDDSVAFYRSLGDTLKHLYAGYRAWIISSDLEAMKFIGLKPVRKYAVLNGPLECRFNGYDLFSGTLKEHKSNVEK